MQCRKRSQNFHKPKIMPKQNQKPTQQIKFRNEFQETRKHNRKTTNNTQHNISPKQSFKKPNKNKKRREKIKTNKHIPLFQKHLIL